MRAPNGSIKTITKPLNPIYQSWIARIPFLRGLIMLWDSLGLGMQAITESANLQSGDDEKLEGPALFLVLFLTIIVGVGVFFLIPAGVGWLSEEFLNWNAWWSNVLEGVLRLVFILAYIWLIGYLPDIRRVFAYHGAEHKTINAYEAGADLEPGIVAKFSIEHPRCGTAFLLILVILSLFFFTILGPLPIGWRLISRVVMIPVLAGIAYEYLRWTANHFNARFVRLLVKPNLALQHLTTREPDEAMLEVAIQAFSNMKQLDEAT